MSEVMSMELKDILDLGMSGVLAYAVWQLWREAKDDKAYIRNLLDKLMERDERAEAQRTKIAEEMGVDFSEDSNTRMPVQKD